MGAPALASLLVDHAKVDPVLRRKLHLLLASNEGSDKLVAEIEKRIRTIGRSKSHIGWERTKDIVQELDHLRDTIAGQLASQDRMEAVERMWGFTSALRAHGEAEIGLSRLDQQDVEEIVEHPSEMQRQLKSRIL